MGGDARDIGPSDGPCRAPSAAALLEIVKTLTSELQPGRRRIRVELDTDLDRELGFDSLSRVELLLRIECELDVRLPDQVLATAETPRDLLEAASTPVGAPSAAIVPLDLDEVVLDDADTVPARADTLNRVLAWRAEQQPNRTHIQLYEPDSEVPLAITFADLNAHARRLAAGLVRTGLERGQTAAIMLPTGRDYVASFFGVLLAGGVPVPIYPPARLSQLEDHLRRHAKILASASARLLITVPEARTVGRLLKTHVMGLRAVVTPADLATDDPSFTPVPVTPDDVALLQYTSGSTGQPKGVVLTHAQLLANIRAMGEHIEAGPEDTFVSWLPMYHDMGLIGAWLGSLYYAMSCVLMQPMAFLARPWRWLWTIHRHKATICAGPNFAYELCLSKIPAAELEGLNLSSLRLAFNGAEPVSPHTLRRFGERFAPYGLDPVALTPVYGLAECAVGLTFPPLRRGSVVERVRRTEFERSGRAVTAPDDDPHALEFVACGQPLPGYQIRIVDAAGRELADREEGRLEFQGPSSTSGYVGNPEATEALFDGDWLDSGDLAYISGGDVYLTSRVKDLIIRAGRNIYPYELEEAVGDLAGVRKGCVAVFGSSGADTDVEQLVVVAETRETEADALEALTGQIRTLASDILGVAPDEVLLVPPRTVLKTSSGKIRRAGCRELYESGELGRGPRATWWQLARLWLTGLRPRWRQARRAARDLGYAGWVYVAFALVAVPTFAALAVAPSLGTRWRVLRSSARILLALVGVPLLIQGREHVPMRGCVVVANHSSYLDGLVLLAALPQPMSFVAKAELKDHPVARWFLGRINTQFVERFDVRQGTNDAKRLSALARDGRGLVFFPEGTFTRYPGVLPFHMGAFVTAAENDLPVVPITLRGTRSVLRGDDFFPRRGTVAVIVGTFLTCAGRDWQAAIEVRDSSRAAILKHAGEPDLAFERAMP